MTGIDQRGLLPVVIIGSGLGGSAAAAFLAHGGIDTVVLERHHGPSDRPRAWIVSPRTLELLRELDLDGRITERGAAGTWNMVRTDTLVGAPDGDLPVDESVAVSATGSATCDQDIVEDVLRGYAVEHGADIRWGRTVTEVVDRGDVVEVHLEDGDIVRARAAIVAEGARADLLPGLGISTTVPEHGDPGMDERFDQVLFRSADLDELMRSVPGNAFVCTDAGALVFRRDLGRWQLQQQGHPIDDPEGRIAAAVGRPVDVHLLDHSSWSPSSRSADRYRTGNVFLVGDAAHSFPPSLGMGGNLAIADAHDLAWKLLWVLTGRAGAALLDSYEAERRPIGTFIMRGSIDLAQGNRTVDLLTAQLGLGYPTGASPALLGEGTAVTVTDPHSRTPVIGARLPHHWLPDGRSTVDLTSLGTFAAVGTIAEPAADVMSVPYTRIPSLPDAGAPDTVWLVRPDGHVAAQVRPEEVDTVLDTILARHR